MNSAGGSTLKHPANPPGRFVDRRDAGRRLADRLQALRGQDPIVLALPRGGVPVGFEVALALGAPLDVLMVRKLGAPGNPEFAIGAVAEDGTSVVSPSAPQIGVSEREFESILAEEAAELHRRTEAYRGSRPPPALAGRTVIVVDDGVATGLTDTAALRAVRRQAPHRLVLAVPICAAESVGRLLEEADEVVILQAPFSLNGVGRWYHDFSQVGDEEVLEMLRAAGDGGVPKADPPEETMDEEAEQ